jgi:hypothetical protein
MMRRAAAQLLRRAVLAELGPASPAAPAVGRAIGRAIGARAGRWGCTCLPRHGARSDIDRLPGEFTWHPRPAVVLSAVDSVTASATVTMSYSPIAHSSSRVRPP